MSPEDYVGAGRRLKAQGVPSDGCSFIGWLLDDKYNPACWAHDYGREDLLDLEDQSDNDNHFRTALRHLGMSKLGSNLIYYATKTQGFVKEKFGLSSLAFAFIIGFIIAIPTLIYFQPYFNS